jgi:hypothetical protein
MADATEALVIVNGHALTQAQSLTLRVALEHFAASLAEGLAADEYEHTMTTACLARIAEIRDFLYARGDEDATSRLDP